MISVTEAKAILAKNINPLKPVTLSLEKVGGHILAEDIFAICDIPAFSQSSMDGYAFNFKDKDQHLKLNGEMAAGTSQQTEIAAGEASRIFTGAPLPNGADTVVMQEKVHFENGFLVVGDEHLKLGSNVRKAGAEVTNGTLAMEKDTLLSPAAIGFLAQIGIQSVSVYPMPSVAIILTGKELQTPGQPLSFGQVYEANSFSLATALTQAGINDIEIMMADDDLEILRDVLQQAIETKDVVLLTGGVSVGDYDFVIQASQLCGVQQLFHKVKQKPGKPLFIGKKNDQFVFGLPGNPSSVLNCFYNYVLPTLHQLSNKKNSVQELTAILTTSYEKPKGLTHFLKGFYADGKVTPLAEQESFRLSAFSQANCLICLPEDREIFNAGDQINILHLPH
ncbi:molybdopterin molybdotransferase MoeA [Pedobacter sandarakinus]|uniref:molybdopterin molybdotransferase MoeA n=1 Tax=Pedobacter sandarakinus TaxID=353156 RepID=UPI002246DB7B|nr:gephyrin-like molybdotransferase Glp [Pedobacter sandarakinus]MCX2575300.1 molybdopterin molybdotransferase MoeA [Pedobacter sandarakinus]